MKNKQLDGVKSGWTKTLLVSTAVLGSMVLFTLPQQAQAATTSVQSTTVQGGVTSGAAKTNDISEGTTGGSQSEGTDDTNDGSDVTETPVTSTPATEEEAVTTPSETAPVSASTTNTDSLKTSSSDLQNAVDTAKDTGVAVTENDPKVVTTTPDDLAETVAQAETDNATAISDLKTATENQEPNNAAYAAEKEVYDNNTVAITSSSPDNWTDEELIQFLGGGASATTETASDEAKKVADITFSEGAKRIDATNKTLNDGNLPSWTYEKAFTDPQSGRLITVVESITGYTPAKGTTNSYIDTTADQIGFTPHNVQDISASVKYYYADTGEPATLDLIAGFADLDGNQGIKVTNSTDAVIYGNLVEAEDDGSYRNFKNSTLNSDNPSGQAWVLQKGVTETDYTFYVGLNANGTVNNTQPIQYIGGAAFSIVIPTAPTLKTETVSYQPTIIQVTTDYTVNYSGPEDETPASNTQTVTWTGNYDADSGNYVWTPDVTDATVYTPHIDGYAASSITSFGALTATTTDPQDETVIVSYQKVGLSENIAKPLTVNFMDVNGEQVKSSVVLTGAVGNSYSVTQEAVDGYRIIGVASGSASLNGELTDKDQTITLLYSAIGTDTTGVPAGTLTVNYQDVSGKLIKTSTLDGTVGKGYAVTQAPIDGYQTIGVAPDSASLDGTLTETPQTITLLYSAIGQETTGVPAGTLTVNYQDVSGKLIKTSTLDGTVGKGYAVTQAPIDGYQTIGVAPDSASLDGTLTETPQTITLLYSAIGQETTPQKSGPLTINYVDENGNPLAPSVTKTASVGNGYLVTHQDIPGYTYVSLATGSATPTGTFTADNQVITYVYQKNIVSSPDNGQGTTDTPTTGTSTDDQTPSTPGDTPVTTTDEPATTQQTDSDITDGTEEPVHVGQLQQTGAKTTVQSSQKADLSQTTAPVTSTQTITWSMGQPAKTTGQYGNQAQKTTPQTTLPQTNDTRESGTLGLLGLLVGLFGLALTRKRKQQ
ncbi:MucBP domain-containing protein [Secundilactobacillus paracollinoides]|uniref:Gram-positive cocci surface proteins LPxTG domain-containing protein n=1 Tax=Secundilactobacillus paracollinoides TaxID=240427 RepID=A0A1B2IW78_9LACO|nr:MucBP domain-containing protein [Secundilactobacillus paracollinoides]ANZ66268.1 hypothetical protein AYR63_03375 [Secundilactobacillus paracollinoides]